MIPPQNPNDPNAPNDGSTGRPVKKPTGRGAGINPPNRFESARHEADWEHLEHDEEYLDSLRIVQTEYIPDTAQSIVSSNDSPDIPFRYSLNPYRGCQHGCSYCYARPTHEYLGYSAGLDFEAKIHYKPDAARLLRDFLARPDWQPEEIVLSGVTDCYQPAEREFGLTRACLEVASECHQPIGIITKNALIRRDLDILTSMAERNIIQVRISITTLDPKLARNMEPRTSTPAARLRAVEAVARSGIPVGVMVAPIIPGLNDSEIPAILAAAKAAGAQVAGYTVLRLPLAVEPVFRDWLSTTYPEKQSRVEGLQRQVRDGKLSSSQFGERMRGTGLMAEQIRQMFKIFSAKEGLDRRLPPSDTSQFKPPREASGQGWLF